MAQVTLETARTARSEAARLRGESLALKLAMRQSAARSQEQREKAAAEMTRVCAQRHTPLPSPWSGLAWVLWDEALEQTLVPVPVP